jgi:hypothetical protein
MPSVKRPELQAAKERPMVVKVQSQSVKNQKVEFRQSTILNFFKPTHTLKTLQNDILPA